MQMSAGAIAAIIAFSVFMIGQFLTNIFGMLMIVEIDREHPERNLFELFGFRRLRGFYGYREYREFCPKGKLHIYALACFAIASVAMIALIVLVFSGLASAGIE